MVDEVLFRVHHRATNPERREASLGMTGDANPVRIDMRSPEFIVQEERDVLADVDRALPELAPRVHDRCVVSVRAIVIKRGHDVAARRQKLGKPGVVESVAAMPV